MTARTTKGGSAGFDENARPMVFFDFGGTLASLDPLFDPPWKVWARVAEELQLKIPHSRLERANEEADRRFGGLIYAYHGRTADFWRLRDMWVIDQLGVKRRKEEFFDALQAMFDDPSQIQLYPETLAVLADLRSQGFSMGVISNFTDKLLTLLQHHGLREFFETVTYSQEVGAEKPDGRVFSLALRRAHRKPAGAILIGDSWPSDYMGARQAGLRAIWLNRNGGDPPEPCEMIRALSDVPPLLAQRNTEHYSTGNPLP